MSTRRGNILRLASMQGRYQPKSIGDYFGQIISEAEKFQKQGKIQEAIVVYRSFIEGQSNSLTHVALFNLGVLLSQSGQSAAAVEAYREAINIAPDFLEPRINLGSLLEHQKQYDEAIALWLGVADANNGHVPSPDREALCIQALNNAGRLLESRRDYPKAEAVLRRSLSINPRQPDVIQHWVHLRQKQCIWPVFEALPGVSTAEMLLSTSPLAMLAHTDDPSLQLIAAQNFVQRKLQLSQTALAGGKIYEHRRLRIGYLSGDLCVHAVGLLLAEVICQHDRDNFEIYAFDFSHDDGSTYQARLRSAFDHRHDIRGLTDSQAAQLIANVEIDLLVDLQGLSSGTRPGILAQRPAPFQVSWLGFIGTSAMPWIDYVIGDRFALTEEMQPFFTEKFLHMATAFLPRDPNREQGAKTERRLLGLPDDKVVLASFNNAYKLNAEMFAAWINILQRAPNTVLWLLDDNPTATANLRRTAAEAGIDCSRLIFTERTGYADFISRLELADLFLDSYPYNAGSTAHDALCAGVPMLTMSGKSFVSRMAGSLLAHAKLPELVTFNVDDYIDRAVELSTDPPRLESLRERIRAHVSDQQSATEQARALESVFLQALGKAPQIKAVSRAIVSQAMHDAWPQILPDTRCTLVTENSRASVYGLPEIKQVRNALIFTNPTETARDTSPEWQYFLRVRDFFRGDGQAASKDKNRLFGFVPHDFEEMAGLGIDNLMPRLSKIPKNTSVVGITLPADDHAFFLNVFEKPGVFDPEFIALSEKFFSHAGIEIQLTSAVMDARQSIVSPFFLARPAFWQQWLTIAEQLYDLMQSDISTISDEAASLRAALAKNGGDEKNRSRAILLLERLAAVTLLRNPKLHAVSLSSLEDVAASSNAYSLANAVVVSNALKLAMRETGQQMYGAAFAVQREQLLVIQQNQANPDLYGT